MIKKIKIAQGSEDQRLDKYLKRLFSNLSQSFIEKNLRKKNILINGLSVKSKYLVNKNDLIIITFHIIRMVFFPYSILYYLDLHIVDKGVYSQYSILL